MEDERTDIERLLSERAEIERVLKAEFSKQVSVMFTDIKGSTSFYETKGDLDGRAMVHAHNEQVFPQIKANHGTLLKTIGDATLSIFDDPVNGVSAAVSIQRRLHDYNLKRQETEQIHVRIGLNFGTGIVEENDVYGDVVNVASRVESLAEADQILVTEDMYRKVKGNDEFTFRYVNSFSVKGKREPIKVYRLVWHEEDLCMGKTRKPLESVHRRESVFIIDASVSGHTLKISGFERIEGEERAVREYAEGGFNQARVSGYTTGITDLLNRANRKGKIGNELLVKLKEYGGLLYDELIPAQIKGRLAKTEERNLMISIDDNLVQIPWELLFDGKEFLCQRFNMGRTVSTRQAVSIVSRVISRPLKMQILADPRGDLPASYSEGIGIKNEIGKLEDWVDVSLKTTDIKSDYVKAKMRNFDILHYAGHGEHDAINPSKSGWILKDGKITGEEIIRMTGTMPMPSLVFSNACQTGQTDEWKLAHDYEEKIFGLANAFLISGVQHYIGTFWEIPDDAGSHFAIQFYKILVEGVTIGEAMRRARYRLIEKYGEDMIVWAGYMLYGDPTARYIAMDAGAVKGGTEKEEDGEVAVASGLRNKEEVIRFPTETPDKPPAKRGFIIAAAAILVIAGIISGFVLYAQKTGVPATAPAAENIPAKVSTDDSRKRIDELVVSLAANYRQGKIGETAASKDEWSARPVTVVFMDLKTEAAGMAEKEKFIHLLSQFLQSEPRVRVVERELLMKLLEELKLSSSTLADPATSLKLGKLLSGRIMVTGSMVPEDKGQTILLRFIDTETSAVRKSLSVASPSQRIDQSTVNQIGAGILNWVREDFPIRGRIVSVSGDQCEVNLGRVQGVKKGDRFEVLSEPKTKGSMYAALGEIEIREVEQDRSRASFTGSSEGVKVGAKVRGK